MNYRKILLLWICGLCISNPFAQRITMLYQETVCPPAWNNYYATDSTFINLKLLLKKDSIEVFKIRYTGKMFEMTCAGCQCLTGRNIEVTIDESDEEKLRAHRFCRPWVWMEKIELVCDSTVLLNDEELTDRYTLKNLHLQGLYIIGAAAIQLSDCHQPSGRIITIKINADDQKLAEKEGFVVNLSFTEY